MKHDMIPSKNVNIMRSCIRQFAIHILGPDRRPIGEWMKHQLRKNQPANTQLMIGERDSPKIQATKRLVVRMIQPVASHRYKMGEACTKLERIRGMLFRLISLSTVSFW